MNYLENSNNRFNFSMLASNNLLLPGFDFTYFCQQSEQLFKIVERNLLQSDIVYLPIQAIESTMPELQNFEVGS